MTLLDMQRAFSRMLTDKSFQHAFLAGREHALHTYDLTDRELLSLRGLQRDRAAMYARMLAGSRLELALKAFPLTSALLHEQLHPFIDRFCAEFPPVTVAAGQVAVESARLGEFVLRLLDEGLLTPYWAKDIVIFEQTRFSLSMNSEALASGRRTAALNRIPMPDDDQALLPLVPVSGPHARLAEFRHDLVRIVPRIAAGEIPAAPLLERSQHILFVKEPGVLRVHTNKVNDATVALLTACDGRRTTADVLDRLPEALGRDHATDRSAMDRLALRALRGLRELGVIAFRQATPADLVPTGG